jgi:nucleoside-diphosphate-sugar epimerase
MRVVVTGALGRIGAAVTRDLAAGGHDVLALARPPVTPAPLAPGVRLIPYDAVHTPMAELAVHLSGVDAVVHCAGLHHDADRAVPPATVYDVNTAGTARLALAARTAGVQRFVFLSSTAVSVLDEPFAALAGSYVRSKRDAERFLTTIDPASTVVLRLGWVVDPADRVAYDRLWPADGRIVIVGSLPVPLLGLTDAVTMIRACVERTGPGILDGVAGSPTQAELMALVAALTTNPPRILDVRTAARLIQLSRSSGAVPTWLAQSTPECRFSWERVGVRPATWQQAITALHQAWDGE